VEGLWRVWVTLGNYQTGTRRLSNNVLNNMIG